MKKYNNKINVIGDVLAQERKKKGYSKTLLCRKLKELGVNFDRNEIYRIENFKMSVKDFELIALASVLEIDFNDIKNIILDRRENSKSIIEKSAS